MTPLNLQGKTILVTGATSGIGYITARELARMGAEVILIGRNPDKTAASQEKIRQETQNHNIRAYLADLSLLSKTRLLAEEIKTNHPRVDVLVNNAGALFMSREVTAEGLEKTFTLNHLSYFLLTLLLLEPLKASPSARVINVSSGGHYNGKLDFNDMQYKDHYAGWSAYARSKLMNVLFSNELARRLAGTHITSNALQPGYVATNFGLSNGGFWKFLFGLSQVFATNPEKGAETSIYLASSPDVEGVTGKYFSHCKELPASILAQDPALARALWERSLEITGLGDVLPMK